MLDNIKNRLRAQFEGLDAWFFPHPALWGLLALFAVIQLIWQANSGLHFDYGTSWKANLFACWLLFLGVRFQARSPVIGAISFTFAFMLLIGPVLRTLTYLGTAAGFPLIDPWIARFDQMVGFDWVAHVAWVNSYPSVVFLLDYIYMSIVGAMLGALAILLVMGRFDRIRELVILNSTLTLLGVLFCTFLPAIGAYAWYAPDALLISNIPETAGRYHLEHFTSLRDGSLTSIETSKTIGIITFPSFHTVVPVLLVWSLRQTPWFWPGLPLGLIMVASTLSIGGHHLGDVMASFVLCAVAVALYHKYLGLSLPNKIKLSPQPMQSLGS
ncbi:MAG: phosphatase PAP2 family protein [Anderseniella sp.]